jgi:tetratricopeptide (TPR) repeat protein
MSLRFVAVGIACLFTATAGAQSSPGRSAQPAVLILRTANAPERSGRRLEIVQPRGLTRLPFSPEEPPQLGEDGTPELGPEYTLARTCDVRAGDRELRYFIYSVDLAQPGVARQWAELEQTRRSEQRRARAEAQAEREWEQRKQRLLAANEQATREGLELLQAGEYRQALITLTRAAEMNHGDPVCRIHLAQVRVALGHDAEAGKVLRRALELQPKLVPTLLDLGQYYPHPEDFAIQVDALAQRVAGRAGPAPDELLMLGFMTFQAGWFDDAHAAFRRAAAARPKDTLVRTYLDLTKPATAPPSSVPASGR